jgi:DnaJ-class molecular chaperone
MSVTRTKKSHHPPMRRCANCGSVGRRLSDECQRCHGVALVGGRWVIDVHRRILVWRVA